MEENGETLKCPKCGSENVYAVHPFDYIKQCEDCGKQFVTGVHN
jgi:ribosomal protein S27E